METIKVTDEAARIIAKFRDKKEFIEHKVMMCDAFSAASEECSSLRVFWALSDYNELINELAKTE